MTHAKRCYPLAICLALFSTGPAFTQIPSTQSTASAATIPVAYVYVGTTTRGIYLYDAAANGKLTLVSGSPFKNTGLLVGSNGKYLFSLGTDWVHVYGVATNGAMKPQVFTLNTQNYLGANCGTTSGAVLDHTGQDLYVLLDNARDSSGNGLCAAHQTFSVGSSSGALTFKGATIAETASTGGEALPTITGNDKYAFTVNNYYEPADGIFMNGFGAFIRETDGTLEPPQYFYAENPFDEDPAPDWAFIPFSVTADPSNHLAVYGNFYYDPPKGGTNGPAMLASYTVKAPENLSGYNAPVYEIVSTNNSGNMPVPLIQVTSMKMSPSGKFLAVGGNTFNPGLQVFHFNGAAPITPYGKPLVTASIDQIHWDNANHLYAVSNATEKMYVFTVTASSVTQAPGSPYTIPDVPNALVVVPK
jgi:hypothetical protein